MKYITYFLATLAVAGCSSKSPFDITPEQAKQHVVKRAGPGGVPDLNHLPPGAVKHEVSFKKGDRLPDGSIAEHDGKIVRVEVNRGP